MVSRNVKDMSETSWLSEEGIQITESEVSK
jgi:hypothetical protein